MQNSVEIDESNIHVICNNLSSLYYIRNLTSKVNSTKQLILDKTISFPCITRLNEMKYCIWKLNKCYCESQNMQNDSKTGTVSGEMSSEVYQLEYKKQAIRYDTCVYET